MNDIFISYKVHNRATAIEYYKKLISLNYIVWFDQLVPKDGDFKEFIEKNIKDTKLVICLLSKECLIDNWVLYQINLAKKYDKKIVYIALDNTNWSNYNDYILNDNIYEDINDLNIDKLFEIKKYNKIILPIIYSLFLIVFGCILLFQNIKFFNLKLNNVNGTISIITGTILLFTIIKNKIVCIVSSCISIIFLIFIIYLFPPNYISGISINPIYYLLLINLGFYIIYSKYNNILRIVFGLFYSIFLSVFSFVLSVFVNYFFGFDISFINIIILLGYFSYNYFNIRN